MLIGINERYQIKQVRTITDESLTVIDLDENNELYPFKDWLDVRILSYCYKMEGNSVAIYPYIDLKIIEKLELQEQENLTLALAIAEVYEILTGGGQ